MKFNSSFTEWKWTCSFLAGCVKVTLLGYVSSNAQNYFYFLNVTIMRRWFCQSLQNSKLTSNAAHRDSCAQIQTYSINYNEACLINQRKYILFCLSYDGQNVSRSWFVLFTDLCDLVPDICIIWVKSGYVLKFMAISLMIMTKTMCRVKSICAG